MKGIWILSTDARRPGEKDKFKSFYIKLEEDDVPIPAIWKGDAFWIESVALKVKKKKFRKRYEELLGIDIEPVVKFHSFLYR